MRFLAALSFLTIVPVSLRREASPEEIGGSIAYFPVVGVIIGLVLAGLNWLLSLFLPLAVVNGLLIAALVILTGAMHLDGFVDTCDGIAGHKTVAERWQVMRDSRVGAFGVVSVVLLLLVKYVSLSNVPGDLMIATLLFMPLVSRWAVVFAIFAYPYARSLGLGAAFKQGTRWPQFTVATFITIVVSIALIPIFHLLGLAILFCVAIVTVLLAVYFKTKFSGLTGDTYGAINEVTEVCVLILVVLLVHIGLA